MTSDQDPASASTPASAEAGKAKRKGSVGPRSLKGRIGAGVLIIIPLAVTAILIRYVYNAALAVGARCINWCSRGLLWAFDVTVETPSTTGGGEGHWYQSVLAAISEAAKDPPEFDPSRATWFQNLLAVILTVLLLYLLGWLGTNVVGRRVLDFVEGLVERIPLVDMVYGAIKRMVGALSGADKPGEPEKQVVLIDFPHENMNAIAFMTNIVTDRTSQRRLATVYVPTTPNPTSGYMLIVPMDRITQTDWTMEEALSMILSGGATARPEVHLSPPGRFLKEGGGSKGRGGKEP